MKFLISDDHAIVRKGLMSLLKEEFRDATIYEASNSHEALKAVADHDFDVILLDISMPGRNGIETLKHMRSIGVGAPILMISMHSEDQYAIRALKAGASGFLNKQTATEELLSAVHKVLGGKKYISQTVAEKLAEGIKHGTGAPHESLSDREMEVFQKIAGGKTVSDIAEEMSLSVNTVSTYRTRIMEKLSLSNNAELTRYALDHELI